MAKRIPKNAKPPEHDNPAGVQQLIAAMSDPLKPVVEAIRATILGADNQITEGIKWNSPSFYRHGWFATVNVRRGGGSVMVVLHHGAKGRAETELSRTLRDPKELLEWAAVDRALVSFTSAEDFESKRKAFAEIIRQWAAEQARLNEVG